MEPSHPTQAPEGAPLPRQGLVQRVVVQIPGSASHRRSIAAVVSEVGMSLSINQRGGRGGGTISSCRVLTCESGSRGRSTAEARFRPESCRTATWKCESQEEQSSNNSSSAVRSGNFTLHQSERRTGGKGGGVSSCGALTCQSSS